MALTCLNPMLESCRQRQSMLHMVAFTVQPGELPSLGSSSHAAEATEVKRYSVILFLKNAQAGKGTQIFLIIFHFLLNAAPQTVNHLLAFLAIEISVVSVELKNTLNISGWVNQFLSWEGFEPLAKLSYNIYLIHMTIMFCLIGKMSFTSSLSTLGTVIISFSLIKNQSWNYFNFSFAIFLLRGSVRE